MDRYFFIGVNRREFEEHLPLGFVEYMISKIEDEGGQSDFWYEALEGEEGADYDGFIQDFLDYKNQVSAHQLDDIGKRRESFDRLASYEIGYPLLELEEAELLLCEGQKPQALALFRKLSVEYPDKEILQIPCADALYRLGQVREAERIYEKYLKKEDIGRGYRFLSLFGMAKIRADQKEWREAGRLAREAFNIGTTDEFTEFYKSVLPKAIKQYEKNADRLTIEEARDLGEDYIHTQKAEAGLAFFSAHPEYCQDQAWWHKLMGGLHLMRKDFKETVSEAARWRECLKQEDGEEDRKQQLAAAYEMEGIAWLNQYEEEKDKEDRDGEEEEPPVSFIMAESSLKRAIELDPEKIGYHMNLLLLYRMAKDYKNMEEICERVKGIDPNYYWAYFYLQEAYEGLHMAQGVIDTFYQAKRLYNGAPEIYERAAEVFISYRQYDDARGILRQAEEAGVESLRLLAQSLRVEERLARTKEEWQAADARAEQVICRMKKEKASKELLAGALMTRYYLNEDESRSGGMTRYKAMEYIWESERLVDDTAKLYYIGRLYRIHYHNDKKAYHYLKLCEDRGMTFEWVFLYLGMIRQDAGKRNEAIAYYQKAAESNPASREAYWRIGWAYLFKYTEMNQPEDGRKALEYFLLQDEKGGVDTWNYWRKAKIRYYMGEYEAALEDVEKSFAPDGDSGQWLLKANILRLLHRYDDAIESYLNSIHTRRRHNEDNEFSIERILSCYGRKGDYQGSIVCLEKLFKELTKEEERKKCCECLTYAYAECGNTVKALYWIKEEYGSFNVTKRHCKSLSDEANRICDIYKIWRICLPASEGRSMVKKYLAQTDAWIQRETAGEEEALEDRISLWKVLADNYFYIAEFETAIRHYESIYEISKKLKDYGDAEDLAENMLITYYHLGDRKKAAKFAGICRRHQDKKYKEYTDQGFSVEELLGRQTTAARANLYKYFLCAFYTGKTKKAYSYVEMMQQRCMCYWCGEGDCTEMKEAMALLAYQEGDMERTRMLCEEANRCSYRGKNASVQQLLLLLDREGQ